MFQKTQDSHTLLRLTLPDGRLLEYLEAGDPTGYPVLFFHGIPGTCEGIIAYEHMIPDGVRIISVSRPGLGGSTFQKNRKLLDWPHDITCLLDHLGIEKCSAIGISGGTPYTLALAAKIPDRINIAACNGTLAPIIPGSPWGWTKGMGLPMRISWFLNSLSIPQLNWLKVAHTYLERLFMRTLVATGLSFFRERGASLCNAYRQPRGLAWDRLLVVQPWGFDTATIAIPVHFWIGESDILTPPSMAYRVAKTFDSSILHSYESEGHISLPEKYFREIVESVVV